jgi:actin-like ATPase involved in cell morphogenesis
MSIGGDEWSADLENRKKTYNLLIGERTAEYNKIKIGSRIRSKRSWTLEVKGRDQNRQLPKNGHYNFGRDPGIASGAVARDPRGHQNRP